MRKIQLKKRKFSKKIGIEIPKIFLERCHGEKDKEAYIDYNDSFIIIANDRDKASSMKSEVSSLLERDDLIRAVHVTFQKAVLSVPYRDVRGLFMYDGDIFYREGKSSGKCITDGLSFTSKIKEKYPDDCRDIASNEISEIFVTPIFIIKHKGEKE